jgi:hypothetical protein
MCVDFDDASLVPILYFRAHRLEDSGSGDYRLQSGCGRVYWWRDGVPFVLHEQVSHRVCPDTVRTLRRGPQRGATSIGRHPLTVKVYTPSIAQVNPEMAWYPRRSTSCPEGVQLLGRHGAEVVQKSRRASWLVDHMSKSGYRPLLLT